MPTPHPHARHVRRGVHIPLHVRYNPRGYVDPGTIYVNVPPPLPYPGAGDGGQEPPPVTVDEFAEFAGLPSGFAYLVTGDGVTFLTTAAGVYLVGTV